MNHKPSCTDGIAFGFGAGQQNGAATGQLALQNAAAGQNNDEADQSNGADGQQAGQQAKMSVEAATAAIMETKVYKGKSNGNGKAKAKGKAAPKAKAKGKAAPKGEAKAKPTLKQLNFSVEWSRIQVQCRYGLFEQKAFAYKFADYGGEVATIEKAKNG